MYPHRIRLLGPWDCEPLAGPADQPLPRARRMTMPCRWKEGGLTDFAGRVRFRRRFGYPGQIDDEERVWLTFEGLTGTATITLNGELLGQPSRPEVGFEFKVTPLLRERNELVVEVDGPDDGGLWGEVAMEIRRTAYLRNMNARIDPVGDLLRLRVRGEVVGSADRPLELYLVRDRSNVAYGRTTPFPGGAAFELVSDPLPAGETELVRVDLVDAATVWYRWEHLLDFTSGQ